MIMDLLVCEHPVRFYNKYLHEYVTVPCGKCHACRNRQAYRWTERLERERELSLCTFFVTLTYDNLHLPLIQEERYEDLFIGDDSCYGEACADDILMIDSATKDIICSRNELDINPNEVNFYMDYYRVYNGIPYARKTDIQLFHKRLNKYLYDNVTGQYKNFRFFLVSEYGSTTFRPHFHGIYFVNDYRVEDAFKDAVVKCWTDSESTPLGTTDCQFVRKSACSYVSQYLTKFADLPSFYCAKPLRQFFLCSKHPALGIGNQRTEDLQKVFDSASCERVVGFKKGTTEIDVRPLEQSVENRLFPKLVLFKSLSHSLRVQLYGLVERFCPQCLIDKDGYKLFRNNVKKYLETTYSGCFNRVALYDYLYHICGCGSGESLSLIKPSSICNFTQKGENSLRRLYYISRRVWMNCRDFGYSVVFAVNKIVEYYDRKELKLLGKFYSFQSDFADKYGSDWLALMYPELCYRANYRPPIEDVPTLSEFFEYHDYIYQSSKQTHFKNGYLDALHLKNKPLCQTLKKYFYAKKRYEVDQALSA